MRSFCTNGRLLLAAIVLSASALLPASAFGQDDPGTESPGPEEEL